MKNDGWRHLFQKDTKNWSIAVEINDKTKSAIHCLKNFVPEQNRVFWDKNSHQWKVMGFPQGWCEFLILQVIGVQGQPMGRYPTSLLTSIERKKKNSNSISRQSRQDFSMEATFVRPIDKLNKSSRVPLAAATTLQILLTTLQLCIYPYSAHNHFVNPQRNQNTYPCKCAETSTRCHVNL